MTKLAKTRVRARKGDQSWSLAISEDRQARRVMICTVSTLRPAYLHAAHVCRLPSRSARQCAGMQDTALKPCRSRPCALACPQTWSMTSSDRPCEPGHAFSPTLSSTFWLRLVPDRAPGNECGRKDAASKPRRLRPYALARPQNGQGPALTAPLQARTRVLANFVIHAPSRARQGGTWVFTQYPG